MISEDIEVIENGAQCHTSKKPTSISSTIIYILYHGHQALLTSIYLRMYRLYQRISFANNGATLIKGLTIDRS